MQQLKSGALLQGGKYKIEKVLGQGGFGITYLATQELLDRKVCIKEFFYKEYCERNEATSHVSLGTQSNYEIVERFMQKFLKEARTISQLDHRNIIKIHDIFKENNTAYYVMDYVEGESLNDMVNRRGALPEKEAVAYIERVADALKYLHQRNINHLDIKPSNIMIRKGDYRVILIDFGLSKQYDEQGSQTSTTPVGISHGYAPMEQYKQGGVSTFSPQTDIYALGATLYKLITGNTPPSAMDVLDEGLPSLPFSVTASVAEAIKNAMQPRKVDRPENISEFVAGLCISSPNTSYNQLEKRVQQNQYIVEETKILDYPNVENKEYKNCTEEESLKIDDNSEENAKNNNTNKIVRVLYCVIACIIVYYVLLEAEVGSENSNTTIQTPAKSAQELYQEALKYDYANYDKAIPLLVDASELGYADASLYLGWCYENGKGVAKNVTEAFDWYLKAVKQGSIAAEYYVGFCYYEGIGVNKNLDEAIKHWRIGAEKNNEHAQYCLGICYYNGEGVTKDVVKAKEWFEKAASQGNEGAKKFLKENDFRVKREQNVYQSEDRYQYVSSGIINGHEYVDLGLSVKWATCNVGASSPSNYGDYFAWGEISQKSSYDDGNSVTYHKNIDDIVGNAHYDAARANWGGTWRLPTELECYELMSNCTWTWTIHGGQKGYKVTGLNGNSIFLPAAGWYNGASLNYAGESGGYWSSTSGKNGGISSYRLNFASHYQLMRSISRYSGQSVRPVSK